MSNLFLQSDEVREILTYHCPRFRELPALDLYMDQVLSVTEEILKPFEDEDKVLTSHMINNYVKQKLLPAPVNKKYSRNHLVTLIIVCFLKKVFSFSEIREMMAVNENTLSLDQAYDQHCEMFEKVLKASFTGAQLPTPADPAETTGLLMAVMASIVQKIYAQKYLAFLRRQDVVEKSEQSVDNKEKK